MTLSRRLRLRLLTVMLLIAVVALGLGGVLAVRREYERRLTRALLQAQLQRQQSRVGWSEAMHRRSDLPASQVDRERAQLQQIRDRLIRLGALPEAH